MDSFLIKDLGELSAIGILALVIIALLWFGKFAVGKWVDIQTKQSESQEKLASAINNLASANSAQITRLDHIDAGQRRIEDKIDKLFEKGKNYD